MSDENGSGWGFLPPIFETSVGEVDTQEFPVGDCRADGTVERRGPRFAAKPENHCGGA